MKVSQGSAIRFSSADWGYFQLVSYTAQELGPSNNDDLIRKLMFGNFFSAGPGYVVEHPADRRPGWEQRATYGRHLLSDITVLPIKEYLYEDFVRMLQHIISEMREDYRRNAGARGQMNVPVEGEIISLVRKLLPESTKFIQTFIDPEDKHVPTGMGVVHDYYRNFIGIHDSWKFLYRIDLGVD